jgi:hypothetical protein
MVVVIFATDIATIFVDFFNDEPDIKQAWKGYFFTHLQKVIHRQRFMDDLK